MKNIRQEINKYSMKKKKYLTKYLKKYLQRY